MGGHVVQRALLLALIWIFVIYTIAEYLSTRTILNACAALGNDDFQLFPTTQKVISGLGNSQKDDDLSLAPKNMTAVPDDSPKVTANGMNATIGKVTMLYGPWAADENNQLVLKSHKQHAEKHRYPLYVLNRQIMHGMWSKLSYMLQLVLEELAKHEDERLKWLFWFDLDIIVMNPNIPLEVFLPPDIGFDHINVVVTNDHNGLNSGAFFLRVSEWAAKYLIDIIALHSFQPQLKLKYSDQSAMEVMTLDTKYINNTMYVPQRWFNAYRGPRDEREQLIRGKDVPESTIKPGDLQLHFAGKKTKHLIPTYLALAANNSLGWEMPVGSTKLKAEVALFWKLQKEKETWNRPVR